MTRNEMLHVAIVFAALVAVTGLIAVWGVDIKAAGHFYVPDSGFVYGDMNPWHFLYKYGEWPAIVFAAASLGVLGMSFYSRDLLPYRKAALFFVLLLALGPGLIINACFKDHWGRPRPREISMFGGTQQFHQPWQRDNLPQCNSFPSGHASVAFYFMAPYFVLRRSSLQRARLFLALGIGYGVFMGAARVIQGGHFVSDVLWSGGIVYLSAFILASVLRLDDSPRADVAVTAVNGCDR